MLRFAPAVAGRVLRGDLAPDPDASRPSRTARSAGGRPSPGTIEIRLWILSWGDDVEVLAPAALRDDVADTHRRALARYGVTR